MISHDWRVWIVENLMLGVTKRDVVATLIEAGVASDVSEAIVAEAADSPWALVAKRMLQRVGKRDWILANQAKLEEMSGVGNTVPRVVNIPPEQFFADYYYINRPVILKGLIDDWPAKRAWSLDYLGRRCGNPEVEAQAGRGSESDYEIRSAALKQRVRWLDLLDLLRTDPTTNDFYVTANNGGTNRRALAPLWEDIGEIPGILQPGTADDGFFWLGPRGTITPWHHDLTNNLLVQISGRKRISLASPAQTPRMRNFHHCYSGYNGESCLDHLPTELRPRTMTFDLEPGEILFIPIGWWHHVEGLDLSISLSFVNFVKNNDFSTHYASYGEL